MRWQPVTKRQKQNQLSKHQMTHPMKCSTQDICLAFKMSWIWSGYHWTLSKKIIKKSGSIMTNNCMKIWVKPTPETSCVSDLRQELHPTRYRHNKSTEVINLHSILNLQVLTYFNYNIINLMKCMCHIIIFYSNSFNFFIYQGQKDKHICWVLSSDQDSKISASSKFTSCVLTWSEGWDLILLEFCHRTVPQ